MAAPTDLTTCRPENPEDCTNQYEQQPDRPQDGDADQESDKEQYEPNDDHEVTLPSFDSTGTCALVPGGAHNKPWFLRESASAVALEVVSAPSCSTIELTPRR
jgi:hypothetical protein